MSNNSLSQNAMSACINISRRTLGRYLSGENVPKTFEAAMKIADKLNLSKEELEEYTKIWKKDVTNRKNKLENEVLDKIIKYEAVNEIYDEKNISPKENSVLMLKDEEIITYIKYVLDCEGTVNIVMPPKYEKITDLLIKILSSRKNISIEQIIRLQKTRSSKSNESIKALDKIIPIVFGAAKYKSYYYYEENQQKDFVENEMYIISNKGIVLFDSNFVNGLFSNQADYCNYYKSDFKNSHEKCSLFCEAYDVSVFNNYCITDVCVDKNYQNTRIQYINELPNRKICIQKSNERTRMLFIEEPQIIYGLGNAIIQKQEMQV